MKPETCIFGFENYSDTLVIEESRLRPIFLTFASGSLHLTYSRKLPDKKKNLLKESNNEAVPNYPRKEEGGLYCFFCWIHLVFEFDFELYLCVSFWFTDPILFSLSGKREINVEEDKISELPDEVLVSILSRLTMREAARTSVVARRWLKVWTFCPSLNFAASETFLSSYREARRVYEEEKQEYVNWVNCVLEAYQGSIIDDFHIHFDLDPKYKYDIDRWVNFVIQKGVKRLVIDLGVYYNGGRSKHVYHFPLSCNNIALQRTLHLLRVLKLKYVDVSGVVIEYFISACPCLEKLTIRGSGSNDLVHLNVAGGQSLCLKKVKIFGCSHLRSIRLSATNLLSFKYHGPIIDISYENVPNLVEVLIGGWLTEMAISYFPQLSNYLFRLETLTVDVPHLEEDDMEDREPLEFPVLRKLKNLKLRVYASHEQSLLVFASLIKAAPSLDRLVVQDAFGMVITGIPSRLALLPSNRG
ncbi:F-box/LRR-repeat protein At3g58900-like isoform X2 [Tripterygium wilfordii]|uniref:F-box/LRR-repeat protein At3g58900-like isoform X2 n=1 Tax=Tripterygium wilfordii TaxID=458696 RepID=UPI0018F7FD4E|nr:F-box/LRR-repeat protein At3g58900-like isoform X2 [Tripterygium wilfordii]